jgi:citrate synthase
MVQSGLDGVTVAETRLSDIDGENGRLVIAGYPVEQLAANATYEETLFLLLEDRLPDRTELQSFRAQLAEQRTISPAVQSLLQAAADEGTDPMAALRMGLAAADLGRDDSAATATRVVAVIPTIIATYWRSRRGQKPLESDPELSHAANYYWLLTGEKPDDSTVRGLETYLNTVVDHGLNASTFTARTVVSTDSDLVSAATAAVGALKGPLHGGAPGPALDMLETIHAGGDPESYVRAKLDAGERLMGFGHRVYDVRDPRAAVLEHAAERFYDESGDEAFFETVRAFETTATELLAEHKPGRDLATNVEFYTAVLLRGLEIPRELFTPTFAAARAGGWMAHCLEQREHNRLIRPDSAYVGASGREWTPLDER